MTMTDHLIEAKELIALRKAARTPVSDVYHWWDDDGEYAAVACLNCKAEAPQKTWNLRSTWPASSSLDLDDLPAFLRPQAE